MVLRVGMAIALSNHVEPVSGAHDQVSYNMLAQRLVSGHGFSFPTDWYPAAKADMQTSFWSYGYTVYLAAVYAIFGHNPLVARVIQAVASVLTCWLAYRIGRRLFGEKVGLAAAALTAVYAYLVFFAAALMTQTFYIIAVLASINVALDLAERPSWRGWVLLGVTLGIGALLRQTLLLFVPFLLAWLWWRNRKAVGPRWPVVGLLICLAVIVAFIAPWTIRNYLVYNDFLLLNSNGGFWFYFSNHPNQGTDFNGTYVGPIPDDLRALPAPAMDRALYRETLHVVMADPRRFILLSISRIDDHFWIGISTKSSLASNLGRLLSFTIYLPFMVLGLWLSWRAWRRCLPLYLYVAFDTAFCLISWAGPRYRLPSDAVMMVFAGLAVVTLAERLRLPVLRPTPDNEPSVVQSRPSSCRQPGMQR